MVHPIFNEDTWYYWAVSVGALLSLVGFVVACICSCRHNENKSEYLGLAGMVTITHSDNEGFNRLPTSDVSPQPVTQDTTDARKRSNSANRSLPDIPKDRNTTHETRSESTFPDVIYEATETTGDPSELYATVQDKNIQQPDTNVPEIEIQGTAQQNCPAQDEAVSPYTRLKSPSSNNDEHPYAQVQNIQKTETNQQNRSTVNQLVDTSKPSTSINHTSGNPVAPPRTRRSSSHNSLLNSESSSDIHAASAITGGVQANQDLPYMTPPILMPLPQPPQPRRDNLQQHFSGDSHDSKGYTSISVREPLANIIAQTKAAQQQQRQSPRTLTDPHYATVSDDSDEMYAAIDEQDKVYTSGSETYAQIQPMTIESDRIVQNEQLNSGQLTHVEESQPSAPQPPSVDSLRYVAHAHSRQASSSSATSSVANLGSPKPEKRQANSPLPPPPPPPPLSEGITDVYASVDKRGKSDDRLRSSVSGKSLEDMYAKVVKKKRDTEEELLDSHVSGASISNSDASIPSRKLSLIEISRASWSSHDSVDVQKREPNSGAHLAGVDSNVGFHTEIDTEYLKIQARKCDVNATRPGLSSDPGYEAVDSSRKNSSITRTASTNDPNYEVLHPQYIRDDVHQSNCTMMRNGIDVPPMYSSQFKHRQISNASSEDPGYEKVRLRKRIDLDQDTDSEPNYESMPHDTGEPNYASVCRPGDSDTDPNYESVSHSDPNYESVKYMSVAETEDPPYEQVSNYKIDANPDGYEKVKKNKDIDPDYEKINLNYCVEQINDEDTDDEQYVQV